MTFASRSLRSASRAAASASFAQRSNSSESPNQAATCAATHSGSKRISGGSPSSTSTASAMILRAVTASARCWRTASASAVSARPCNRVSPAARGRVRDLAHLDEHRREVGEPPRCAACEVAAVERRRELDGAQEQLARAAERLARERALARVRQRHRRLLAQLGGRRAVELGEEHRRLVEVERADLEQLVARAVVQPLGERVVQVGAGALRERRVGDLADEHVLELVGLLAADRRARLADDEIAEQQLLDAADRRRRSPARCARARRP